MQINQELESAIDHHMRNKGKQFEKTMMLIQETFKDSDNTRIYSNYKIENESGRKREIDILIVSNVNGFEIKIAIECKDYSKKIPVDKIEAFNSKCTRIQGINKKVFVSSNGYQADAVDSAKYFGIELMTASKLTPEIIMKWFPINQLKLTILPKFEAPILYLAIADEVYIQEISSKFDKMIYIGNVSAPIHINTLLLESVEKNKNLIWGIALIEWMTLEDSMQFEPFKVPFQLTFNDVSLKAFDNQRIGILGLETSVFVQFFEKSANIKSGSSLVDSSGSVKANSITLDIGSGVISDIVIDKNQKSAIYVTNEQGITQKLQVILTYNPKTKTFSK